VDFLLVFSGYAALWYISIYPLWVNALNLLMFGQFIVSYRTGQIVYDPVGKLYGGLVLWALIITLFFPYLKMDLVFDYLFIGTAGISVISRHV
jgi:hypothetical protein